MAAGRNVTRGSNVYCNQLDLWWMWWPTGHIVQAATPGLLAVVSLWGKPLESRFPRKPLKGISLLGGVIGKTLFGKIPCWRLLGKPSWSESPIGEPPCWGWWRALPQQPGTHPHAACSTAHSPVNQSNLHICFGQTTSVLQTLLLSPSPGRDGSLGRLIYFYFWARWIFTVCLMRLQFHQTAKNLNWLAGTWLSKVTWNLYCLHGKYLPWY